MANNDMVEAVVYLMRQAEEIRDPLERIETLQEMNRAYRRLRRDALHRAAYTALSDGHTYRQIGAAASMDHETVRHWVQKHMASTGAPPPTERMRRAAQRATGGQV
jgi:hypothetical protein